MVKGVKVQLNDYASVIRFLMNVLLFQGSHWKRKRTETEITYYFNMKPTCDV